ncbi:hypothetical protein, partial [Dichotomicrobium thermohalophilum]
MNLISKTCAALRGDLTPGPLAAAPHHGFSLHARCLSRPTILARDSRGNDTGGTGSILHRANRRPVHAERAAGTTFHRSALMVCLLVALLAAISNQGAQAEEQTFRVEQNTINLQKKSGSYDDPIQYTKDVDIPENGEIREIKFNITLIYGFKGDDNNEDTVEIEVNGTEIYSKTLSSGYCYDVIDINLKLANDEIAAFVDGENTITIQKDWEDVFRCPVTGLVEEGSFTVTTARPNTAPVAKDDSFMTGEDNTVSG